MAKAKILDDQAKFLWACLQSIAKRDGKDSSPDFNYVAEILGGKAHSFYCRYNDMKKTLNEDGTPKDGGSKAAAPTSGPANNTGKVTPTKRKRTASKKAGEVAATEAAVEADDDETPKPKRGKGATKKSKPTVAADDDDSEEADSEPTPKPKRTKAAPKKGNGKKKLSAENVAAEDDESVAEETPSNFTSMFPGLKKYVKKEEEDEVELEV